MKRRPYPVLQALKQAGQALLLLAACSAPSWAIDLQPGEIRAPRPGITLLQASYVYSERDDFYRDGHRQPGAPDIDSAQYLLRMGQSFEIAEHPAFFYAQLPMGYIHPQGSEGDSGVGDPTALLAFWPYSNHESQTYVAVGAYFGVPTGSYDHNRLINMGENRYRSALQAGFQTQVAGALHWSLAVDGLRFGDNDEFGPARARLEQRTLYTTQTGLRYDINPSYAIAATYFYTSGGESSINGRELDDRTRLQRYQLTGIANYPFGRITLQYGGDTETENGYLEKSRLILRYTTLF